MLFFYKIKNESFNLLYIFIPLLISGFLIVNASKNNGGIPVLNSLYYEIKEAESKLEHLQQNIFILQNKVDLIKGPNVDQDLLEELAYQNLGFAYTHDLFIPIN